jgi:periplasmic protein TonB
MLQTLLESRSRRNNSPAGTIMSVTAHTALIAAALYATAQARVTPSSTPSVMRPIYFPRVQERAPRPRTPASRPAPMASKPLVFVPEVNVDVKVPAPVDLAGLESRASDFRTSTEVGSDASRSDAAGADSSGRTFDADQVEKQAALAPGASPPRYPEALRGAGIEGAVTALFVVDESGRAEEASVRFLRSDNQLFEDAVRVALRRMRFIPAEVGGRKVRQLVQMPFVFTLQK